MFAVMPFPAPFTFGCDTASSASSPYRPAVSSPLSSSPIHASSPPLSPRDPNSVPSRRETQSSPIPTAAPEKPRFRFAGRAARPNPIVQKREDARNSRRRLFLQNVKQRADDQRWERRGGETEVRVLLSRDGSTAQG